MLEKYKRNLMQLASSFDAISESCGTVTNYATSIVEDKSDGAAILLLEKISEVLAGTKASLEIQGIGKELRESLLKYYGSLKIHGILRAENGEDDPRTLEDLLNDLDALVGLETVKAKVNDLIAYQKIQKIRRDNNLHSERNTLHLAFTGNPGTGKTTVARIVGHIYKRIGLLSKGHFVEVSRTDLIAGYQGQTALKVKKVIEKARGGVLFIDEAYSITENQQSDSYGRECLTELTKALEDYRDDLVVIVAGYTEPMNDFFKSNPGLQSRFNTFIEFQDYTVDELEKILESICTRNNYVLDDSAKGAAGEYFQSQIARHNENFSNGRLARNLYDDLVMNHAKRITAAASFSKDDLVTITQEDVPLSDAPGTEDAMDFAH